MNKSEAKSSKHNPSFIDTAYQKDEKFKSFPTTEDDKQTNPIVHPFLKL